MISYLSGDTISNGWRMQRIRIRGPGDATALAEIGEILKGGGVVAYPTDTIYGLGCDPLSQLALERIYGLKGRGRDQGWPLLILLDSPTRLGGWCDEIPEAARGLLKHWPAPLTLVVRVRRDLSKTLLRGGTTLGFRVPASRLCRAVCTAAGGAVTSTSANRGGSPPLENPEEIASEFAADLDALVDAGALPPSLPSTVVRCEGDAAELIRPGAFPFPR